VAVSGVVAYNGKQAWGQSINASGGGIGGAVKGGASPEGFEGREKISETIEAQTLLGRAATLEDVANAAAFAASGWARSMTAAVINVSCGALID
jgi:enoyl-[acyl-carrier-protein] reductase (NADH)